MIRAEIVVQSPNSNRHAAPLAIHIAAVAGIIRRKEGEIDLLKLQGIIDNAIVVQLAADSLAPGATNSNEVKAGMLDWRNVVCPQQNFAVSALNTFNGVDVVSFGRLAYDAMVWTLLARDMDATLRRVFNTTVPLCSGLPDDFRQPVIDKLPGFVEAVTVSLNRLDARSEFDQILKARLPELVELESLMQEFDLGSSVLNLIGEQATRLRVTAYQACRSDGDQRPQRDLLESASLFSVTTPFAEADVREDVQFCGMPLRWHLKNANGQIVGEGTAGGISAGQTLTAVNLPMTGVSEVVFDGPLAALRCPVGSQNNEQLSFSAGPLAGALTSVGLLTPSNESTYLAVSSLRIDVAQLSALALPAGPTGTGRLVVTRKGELCSGQFANLTTHDTIVTFDLEFNGALQILTSALPKGIVGQAYAFTLLAQGGQTPYTWSASGLPPGLNVDAATGVISGTPTTAGSSTVTVALRSADGLTASTPASVTITATSSGIRDGGFSSVLDVGLPSGAVNCPATHVETFFAFPGQQPRSETLSCGGSSGEAAAVTVSFAPTFVGGDLVAVSASGSSSAALGGAFDHPNVLGQFILRFTATRTTQLAIDARFTWGGSGIPSIGFALSRDGIDLGVPHGGPDDPINQTVTLLPGVYFLAIAAGGITDATGPLNSAGFNVQLAFGP